MTSIEQRFLTVFAQGTEEEALFELLRKAYVNASYKSTYRITWQELEWLRERVCYFQSLTEKIM